MAALKCRCMQGNPDSMAKNLQKKLMFQHWQQLPTLQSNAKKELSKRGSKRESNRDGEKMLLTLARALNRCVLHLTWRRAGRSSRDGPPVRGRSN